MRGCDSGVPNMTALFLIIIDTSNYKVIITKYIMNFIVTCYKDIDYILVEAGFLYLM